MGWFLVGWVGGLGLGLFVVVWPVGFWLALQRARARRMADQAEDAAIERLRRLHQRV